MSESPIHTVRAVLATMREHCPGEAAQLGAISRRLDAPLRIAIAGAVKAGKSTLINALLGEEIAPTDAGECTRIVTVYQHSTRPRLTVQLRSGAREDVPIHRAGGRLDLSAVDARADEVQRILVEWPSEQLRGMLLIDTPGIGSLSAQVAERTVDALLEANSSREADAVIYLMRQLHAVDIEFLRTFRGEGDDPLATANAIGVLSRADELAAGRIDAMLSAHETATRLCADPVLHEQLLGLFPLAGLVAQAAPTLREREFAILADFAALERAERERILLSVDRFVAGSPQLISTPAERSALLDRFGVYGIRLAVTLVRGSVEASSADLAAGLRAQSGLEAITDAVRRHFLARSDLLRSRSALLALNELAGRRGSRREPAPRRVFEALERAELQLHGLAELVGIAAIQTNAFDPVYDREVLVSAGRVLGDQGPDARCRLALDPQADDESLYAAAREQAAQWRSREQNPCLSSGERRIYRRAARSADAIAAAGSRTPDGLRLHLGGEPGPRALGEAEPDGDERDEQLGQRQ